MNCDYGSCKTFRNTGFQGGNRAKGVECVVTRMVERIVFFISDRLEYFNLGGDRIRRKFKHSFTIKDRYELLTF